MRISDWSSDVCSSDLGRVTREARQHLAGARGLEVLRRLRQHAAIDRTSQVGGDALANPADLIEAAGAGAAPGDSDRSEEHTSELQSLMRISYAVFCLKKKNNQ